jgi:ABC-2 type transport system ATP-binding protein
LLALSLLGRPRALLLDEPTTAVDPEGRLVIRNLIAAERDRGCALFITTHELSEAELVADRLVIMHEGHILSQGSLDELAGAAEMIVQSSEPVDLSALASLMECSITLDSPLQFRCHVAATPERIARVTNFLASQGASLVSLRTRASLEEHYLELIASERRVQP